MPRLYRSTGLLTLVWFIGSCGGGDAIVGPPPPTVAFVTVSRDTASLVPASTLQLTASARTAAGETLPRSFSWSTSDAAKATVSNSGMVVGVAPGTAIISATTDGKSASTTIAVLEGGVVSITGGTLDLEGGEVQIAVPADALGSSTNLSVAISTTVAGDPRVVKGTAFDFGPGGTIFAKPVALTIRYDPANLPPGTEEAALELYLHTSSGWEVVPQSVADLKAKTVTAPVSHFSTYAILLPEAVAAIAIGGASPLTVGEAEQLTATLTAAGGGLLTNRVVTWSTSEGAVASVSQSGNLVALEAGSTTVSASAGGITSSVLLTVNPIPVATLTLSAPTTPLIVGATESITAMPKDAGGEILDGRTVNWTSSNTAVLTVSSASSVSPSSGATVTVIATGPGTATITATSESVSATTPAITVNPPAPPPINTVTVTPPSANIVAGGTLQLVATLKDVNGNTHTDRAIAWASGAPGVATVDANGLVTAVAAGGPVTITATSEGKSGSSSINVTAAAPPAVASVGLSSVVTPMEVGATQILTAMPRDANGTTVPGSTVSWVSSDPAVLSVSVSSSVSTSAGATVTVTAVGPGGATITARSESAPSAATPLISVNPVPVATVTLSPSAPSLVLGVTPTQQLTATLRDAASNLLTGRTVTWSSGNSAIVTVDANGLVTAVAAGGPVTITATSGTKIGTASITVTLAPVTRVTLSPPTTPIVVGETQELTATLHDAANNALAGRTVTWTSSDPAVLSVSPASGTSGTTTITGVAVGAATITATSESASATTPAIAVNQVPVATVAVTPSSATLVLGITQSQQLTAVARDASGHALTGRLLSWSSSNPAAATVDANGLVTAAAAGGTTITATSETKTGTSSITVALAPVTTVTLSGPATPMVVGGTQQLSATLHDAANNALTGRTVAWTSSNPGVLTVSPSSGTSGTTTVTAVGVGTATITATSESASATTPVITVTPVPVASVTVSPSPVSLVLGTTPSQQLGAVTKDAGGNTLTGRQVAWSSSNPAVATVDDNGLVTAVTAGGPITITATSETKIGTASITVSLAPVAAVTVSAPTTPMVLAETQTLTATPRDGGNNILAGRVVSWVSSNTAVLTVSPAGGTSGTTTVTAVGLGTATITATSESVSSTPTIGITVNPVPVATVTLSTLTAPMVVGETQVLTATPNDGSGTILQGRTVSWVSSNPSVLSVSVPTSVSTSSGATVTVTAIGSGIATITATSELAPRATTPPIVVNPVPVATVSVAPASATLVLGITRTQQLVALTRDASGKELAGRLITWSSSNPGAATVDANGLVTAAAAGGTTITATSETKTGTSSITVTPVPVSSVTLSTPVTPTVVGGTQVLTAMPRDGSGTILSGRTVNWVSSNPAVLSVGASSSVSTSSGATVTVTGVTPGTATISATSESVTSAPTPVITVTPAPVASVTVSPSSASLVLGITPRQQLAAVTRDASGNELAGRLITWSSSNPAAAAVDADGLVTAVSAGGPVTITATSETKTATSSITVTLAPVATVMVSAPATPMLLGATQALTATPRDAASNPLTDRTITWVSSNTAVLTVSPAGGTSGTTTVTAVGVGTATITATSESASATTAVITVTPVPVASVTVSPSSASLVLGITPTQQLAAVTRDANGVTLVDRPITWSSSDEAVAMVDGNGLVTAVGPGGATITASSEARTATASIKVTVAPVATVAVSEPTTPMLVGETQILTATPRDGANNILAGRIVSWISSDGAVLTVTPASGATGTTTVTGVGPGTATITATTESVSSAPKAIVVNPVPVATVSVTPASATLVLGITPTQQLSAVTKDAGGNTLAGRVVAWSSDNNVVATVGPAGLVTAVSAGGPVTITATSETKTGTSSVTVTVAPVTAVTVSAPTTPMVLGEAQTLTATTTDAAGATLTGRTVSWTSNNTAVLTVNPTSGPSGTPVTVTTVGTGTTTITATSEAAPSATTPPITVKPVPVAAVSVTPPSATLVLGITPIEQLTAVTTDAHANELTGRLVTWSSSDAAVATVNENGLVTAVGPGGATITATSETKTGASSITVTLAPVMKVMVSPASPSIIVGRTQQFSAVTQDGAGNVLTGRTVTWVSANPGVATVNASGLVTAESVGGPVEITATSEGQTGTSSITVIPVPVWRGNEPAGLKSIKEWSFTSIDDPAWGGPRATIVTDPTAPQSPPNVVRVTYPAGFPGGGAPENTETSTDGSRVFYFCYWVKHSLNWQGHNTGINKHGYVWMGDKPLFVFEADGSGSDPLRTRMALQGVVTDPNSGWYPQNLEPNVTFTRGQWDYVEILLTGNTSGRANGELDVYLNGVHVSHWTGIQYSSETTRWDLFRLYPVWGGVGDVVNADQYIEWDHVYMSGKEPPPIVTVTVSTPTTPMVTGETQELTATLRDASGNVPTDRAITWVSSDPRVLTVNPASGTSATTTVTAVGVGAATITAASEAVTSAPTPVITVTPVPVATVTVSPSSASLMLGITPTQQLTAVTKDANGNELAGRLITWSSSDPAIAKVDQTGLVTAQTAGGPVTIAATSEGQSGSSSITVNPAAPITLQPSPFITSGLSAPVFLTAPLNDGRVFVVEQGGRIRIVQNGVLQSTPFLDISTKVLHSDERGLLSVAFHPQYATNHFFYVYYVAPSTDIIIERYTASSASAADPSSGKLIFSTPHPIFTNHNGGLVSFGPDGMLYAAFGDGGGGGDPNSNGQNFNAYLGGMIRIDIDHGDPYSVPADNPFVGQASHRPELWAKGLRNPWRYAFDPPTGLLYIADVGQDVREEIDVMPATQGGVNYGWNIMEGLICYNATTCNQAGLQPPILDFLHVGGACSITGGYVYRGSAIPEIVGHYFYSDYCAGWLRSVRYQGGVALDQKDWGFTFPNKSVTSFGQDYDGELYVMSGDSIYKIVRGP